MDQRILHFDWNWQLSSSAEDLWPLLSDTNRLYNNLKLPSVQTTEHSYDFKRGHTQLSYNSLQHSDVWEEEPFEWERPFRFGVKRRYKNGSYKNMKIQVDLLPNPQGTRVRYQIWATTRNVLAHYLVPLKLKILFRNRLKKTLKMYDGLIQKRLHPYEKESKERLIRGARRRVEELSGELKNKTGTPQIVNKLIDFIKYASDIDIARINPYELADYWELSRKKVLTVFLHATKIGLLNFRWNLHCNDCRSIQRSCPTLNEIHEPVFCDECQEEFFINFNHNVRFSFRPNPLVRKVSDEKWCITGPQTKPHIAVKQYLEPGQKRYLKTQLKPGVYNLRVEGQKGICKINVTSSGKDNITISLTNAGLNGEKTDINADPNLTFHNRTDGNQIFILERISWNKDVLTGTNITSQQLFRDLFDKEVLRKGEKIAVDDQTLMFTDLLDSASMYNKEGDEKAVGRVIEHFDVLQEAIAEHDGAIVKTIGDSVMAVFSNPSKALSAFLKAHKVLSSEKSNQRLKLKAGIHHGSCVAVNLNGKIDYFGSTVNIASRFADFADEDEVVLSNSVSKVPDSLPDSDSRYLCKELNVSLRGFEDEQFQIKRLALQKSGLRLVV